MQKWAYMLLVRTMCARACLAYFPDVMSSKFTHVSKKGCISLLLKGEEYSFFWHMCEYACACHVLDPFTCHQRKWFPELCCSGQCWNERETAGVSSRKTLRFLRYTLSSDPAGSHAGFFSTDASYFWSVEKIDKCS